MYWQDTDENSGDFEIPDDVVDLAFNIRCKSLPVDHGEALKTAIIDELDWLVDESQAAIHQIHVAESSHGWQRPDDDNGVLLPSRRTRLVLRMPAHRVDDCLSLINTTIDINGHQLSIGEFKTRPLSNLTTIFARYIETDDDEAEDEFIQRMIDWLQGENITVKKMMSGLAIKHRFRNSFVTTRKLMLSGLSVEDSLRLQQKGKGENRLMGIGIFLPHKGIDAVNPA